MLHTKFQVHRPFGSGEDVLRFVSYMCMVAILVICPGPFEQFFVPVSKRLHMKFDFDWPSSFRGEDV